ncbi:MAG: hypothetical protein H6601_08420 [Flavobacteriales bacterium]|nr:hypothetical protein [Flavobacteriales bacterium]
MKTRTFSNRTMKYGNRPTITPDPLLVSKALAVSNRPTGINNFVVIARYKWLVANGAIYPKRMEKPNLFITINDGMVEDCKFSCVFGRTLQKQSFHIEVLNGPSETSSATKENLILSRDLGLANLCNMALDEFRERDIIQPVFPLDFNTYADDSCNLSLKTRPSDKAVLEILREADVNHWDKNLIIIARQRWLKEQGIKIPTQTGNLNLLVKIVNGHLTSCFYSPDMMNIIRKQNYFIQILN